MRPVIFRILLRALALTLPVIGHAQTTPVSDLKPPKNNYPACCLGKICSNCQIINTSLDSEVFKEKNFSKMEIQDSFAKNLFFEACTLNDAVFTNVFSQNILLERATFTNAILTKTNFKNGTMQSVVFEGGRISRANWKGLVVLDGLELRNLAVDTIDLSGLQADTLILKNVKGSALNLSNSRIENLSIRDSSLPDIKLTGAEIENATVDASDLGQADFSGAVLKNSFVVGVNLIDAKFADFDPLETDFCRSILNFDELDPTVLKRCEPNPQKCFFERYAYGENETWSKPIRKGVANYNCESGMTQPQGVQCRESYKIVNNECQLDQESLPKPFRENNQIKCPKGFFVHRALPPISGLPINDLTPVTPIDIKKIDLELAWSSCKLIEKSEEMGL